MIKPILLACSLMTFAAIVCAQAPEKPSPKAPETSEASPLVVSASQKADLGAHEPKGLLLKLEGPKPGYLRVEWGATRQALGQAMASLSGQAADDVLKCKEIQGETLCLAGDEPSWSGDLGKPSLDGGLKPIFLFSPNGQFYHYMLIVPGDRLEAARSAFKAELGTPAEDGGETKKTLWKLDHTSVVVRQGAQGGEVHGVYVPIAEKTQ